MVIYSVISNGVYTFASCNRDEAERYAAEHNSNDTLMVVDTHDQPLRRTALDDAIEPDVVID